MLLSIYVALSSSTTNKEPIVIDADVEVSHIRDTMAWLNIGNSCRLLEQDIILGRNLGSYLLSFHE
jgi:hypothetical protein